MRKTLTITLLLPLACLSTAFVSTNVPLNHWSYPAIEKLVGQGLIDSAMTTTKPFSRLEMARLIAEADEQAQLQDQNNPIILSIINRLKKEFDAELNTNGSSDGQHLENFIKPV